MDYCSFSDIPIEFLPPVPVPVMQTCPNGQQFLRKGQDRKAAPTLHRSVMMRLKTKILTKL